MTSLVRFDFGVLLALAVGAGLGHAQVTKYGNEWITPGQTYVKVRVAQTGIVRVRADATSLNGRPAANLHLLYRGQEQVVYVADLNSNGLYDGGDFLEFLGRRHDGAEESVLYRDPATGQLFSGLQSNPNFSLFSDTAAYFLTENGQPRLSTFSFSNVVTTTGGLSGLPLATSCRYVSRSDYLGALVFGGGGSTDPTLIYNADFVPGEGYLDNVIRGAGSANPAISKTLDTRYRIASPGTPPRVEVRVAGVSTDLHPVEIRVGSSLHADTLLGASMATFSFSPNAGNLSAAINASTVTTTPVGTGINNIRLAYIQVEYDREFRMNNTGQAGFFWQNVFNADAAWTVRDLGFPSGDVVWAYDLANRRRIQGVVSGSDARFFLPKPLQASLTEFWVSSDSAVASNSDLAQVSDARLLNYSDANAGAEYVIITHPRLLESAQALKLYRDTCSLNPVASTKLVEVDALYDEYAYGTITPLAIKRFVKHALDTWVVKPKYIMLWGKGTSWPRTYRSWNLVPTWGEPASDLEFVANFGTGPSNDIVPRVAIGRYCAQSNKEGLDFVAKLDEYEHTPFDFWMKNGVHLGGGKTVQEQSSIQNYLEGEYEATYEGSPWGGSVYYSQKKSNAVIQNNTSISTRDAISAGSTMLTFFGHSTAEIYEVEMLEAFNYDNWGRYMLIMANGCYGGDFSRALTFGERFIREPGRGCIGYIANSSAGYINNLGPYTDAFYDLAFRDSIGTPLGQLMAKTLYRYCFSGGVVTPSKSSLNQCRCTNLQGDPAMKLYHPPGPDLAIDAGSISFSPDPLVGTLDSFTVSIHVRNIGLAFTDSFDVRVRQNVTATGQLLDHGLRRYPGIVREDTLVFKIGIAKGVDFPGLNSFDVFVDALDSIAEFREDNNRVVIEVNVPADQAVAMFPTEFALVNTSSQSLVAASYAGGTAAQTYEFEIDTSHTFKSAFKRSSGPVGGNGQLCTWPLPFPLADSTVYYWRVRLPNSANPAWATSSFRYIQSPQVGWTQARMPQFFKDPTTGISLNPTTQRWGFDAIYKSLSVRLADRYIVSPPGQQISALDKFEYFLGGVVGTEPDANDKLKYGPLVYAHIDGRTLEPLSGFWPNGAGKIDVITGFDQVYRLEDVIDAMKPGDYLLMASRYVAGKDLQFSNWPASLLQKLSGLGVSNQFQTHTAPPVWLILGRKGSAPGTAIEVFDPNSQNSDVGRLWEILTNLYTQGGSGNVETLLIGPSSHWEELKWNWDPTPNETTDETKLELRGVRANGTDTLLMTNLAEGNYPLSAISAESFPFLRLQATKTDDPNRTAPQLKNWTVHYTPAPECMVDLTGQFAFLKDTLQEGEVLRVLLTARNISNVAMDSVLVRVQLRKADNSFSTLFSRRWRPLPAQQADTLWLNIPTAGCLGNNTLFVTLNPDYDQPEQYLFNNQFQRGFTVLGDVQNPILDVLFDGKRILNGDIVAPSPVIQIQVNDENPYFKLDDPSLVELFLKDLSASGPAQQILSNDPRVSFEPATTNENKASLFLRPGPLADGRYSLEVQSYDKSGNPSGSQRFGIEFEVVNKSTITDIVNYPNPFTTDTRFVYTLTGAVKPDVFKLYVYTVSGKLVRVIDLVELNEVFVGTHMTTWAWDGTDEYGDRLANGVYLYRVMLKMPGEAEIERNDEATRQYFKKGWGKMVLMR